MAGEPEADRRASAAGPKSSAARTALLQLLCPWSGMAGPGTGGTGSTLPPPEIEPSVTKCRLGAAREDRTGAPLAPSDCYGLKSEPKHSKANRA